MPAHSLAEELVQKGKFRLLPPYNWSLRRVADEEGCSPDTVFKWRKQLEEKGTLAPKKPNNTDWSTEQKFAFVLEFASLNELELGEYCRKQVLCPELLQE
ncbi:MAG: helix-turn-helix domain-containing protein [Pseudomonadales bacterium]|nr:helix-turn-helix domain-containing protein [Pseudomonadales bacterium]